MDFLYRNIHMEQKKWDTAAQMTIEEDMNVPDAKGDCLAVLLKDAVVHVEETRVGREQVVIKGNLDYQILYTTASQTALEQLSGNIPFEEAVNVNGAAPGDFAAAKGVIEDFKVSMINTRKISIQSVVMLYACTHQMMEEEWTSDVVNCGNDMQKQFETKEILQLCQKKSDVFRIKEETELTGSYPAIQKILWKRIYLGNMEIRPMDGKISLKGELNCCFIYMPQGVSQSVRILNKKVPFHGLVECSGCTNDRILSVIPVLNQCTVEVKADTDGEDKVIYIDAALDLQIRIYNEEKAELLQDIYSISQEVEPENKTVHAPVLHIVGEGKTKLKQTHRLKEGAARAVQILYSLANVFPDREVWEDGKLGLMGSVQVQILYLTGEEEMPYAVTECVIPYTLEMEGRSNMGGMEKPLIFIEPRIEQMESSLVDSEEVEVKGVIAFSVLVLSSERQQCIAGAEYKDLDTEKFAAMPSMVICFADRDTPLWEYGKKYYMSLETMKKLNGLSEDVLKAGNSMLLVKGAKESSLDKIV